MTTEQAILGTILNPNINAIINVKITNGWIVKLQDDFYKDFQLTHQQYNILRILKGQYPNGVKIMDIKRRMVDKMSNVGRLADKLQQKGFVEKQEDAHDRRVIYVQLTEAGLALFADIQKVHSDTMLSYFNNITEQEAMELVRILEKMRAKPFPEKAKKGTVALLEET
jgi:DNA-binding MarR family transcriptional regulator